MSDPKAAPKKQEIHSPLIRFRQLAHCNECPLCDACLSDKTLEIRCILALIADTQHNTTRRKTLRGFLQ